MQRVAWNHPHLLGLICLRRTLIFFELKYFDSDFPSSDLFNWKTFTFLLVSVLLLFALVDFLGLDKVCGYFTFLCLFSCELLWHSLLIHLGNQINNCCTLLIWGVSLTQSNFNRVKYEFNGRQLFQKYNQR